MKIFSSYTIKEIENILRAQVEEKPKLIRCLISLNINRYVGTSRVCGNIREDTFKLYNRRDPYFSLCANGVLNQNNKVTIIDITWKRPIIPDIFGVLILKRYENDKTTILDFLKQWLNINEIIEN